MKRVYELLNPICPICGRRCGMLPLIMLASLWSVMSGAAIGSIQHAQYRTKVEAIKSGLVEYPIDAMR